MQIIDSVVCGDDFTDAASIRNVYKSNGGYIAIGGQDVYAQLQYGVQGQEVWTPSVHLPVGNGTLDKGTLGIRFRNYKAGSAATVSAGLSGPKEPQITIGSGGVATPSTATPVSILAIQRKALTADLVPVVATDTIVLSVPLTMPATGGPFRVLANWSMLLALGGAATIFEGWVDDQAGGNSFFADTQTSIDVANGSGGFACSAVSRNSYANGFNTTFLLLVRSQFGFNSVKALPFAGTRGETYLEIVVLSSV